MTKRDVLHTKITVGAFEEFIDGIFSLTEEKTSSYVCFANVHMLMEAYRDKTFNRVVNEADIVTPDGRPLSLFVNFFHNIRQPRVAGMDLMPALLAEAERRGKSVFFYGSTDQILKLLVNRAHRELPRLQIAGTYSPPFRELTDQEEERIIDMINAASPDLLFVALGCPKQEKWMAEHAGKIHSCMLGVGQAYNVYAGIEKRLPKWMRNLSLEWAYRLYLEPKRLWRRYLLTNSLFLLLTFKFALRNMLRGRSV